jgi:hypothetical protein
MIFKLDLKKRQTIQKRRPNQENMEETLTKKQVSQIRSLYNRKRYSLADLAKKFETGIDIIRNVITNKEYEDDKYFRTKFFNTFKFTNEDIAKIRYLYNDRKTSFSEIADTYDMRIECVREIIENKTFFDKNYVRTNFSIKRNSILSKGEVAKIRYLYNQENYSYEQLCKDYDMNIVYMKEIIANRRRFDSRYVRTRFLQVRRNGPNLPRRKPAVITPEMAKQIRDQYNYYNSSYKHLSEKFTVSSTTLRKIIENKTYVDPNYKQIRFS